MKDKQFYHMYPLGMLNQLEGSPCFHQKPRKQLDEIKAFIPHLQSLNINALLLGPVFKSVYHGYDTVDYYQVDERLGNNEMLRDVVEHCHRAGMDVMLDCVFNHVSREFFAFKDVLKHRDESRYKDWFYLDFNGNNYHQDGFSYGTWDGHDELVKLNLENQDVVEYLIDVGKFWVDAFHIDGLRLDAFDVMSDSFVRRLKQELEAHKKQAFYLVGEMVHGNYADKMQKSGISSVTNYEAYKGLYSSLNDGNYFEIAYSFKRFFSQNGLLKEQKLYNFVDNHDVNRVASTLQKEEHLYPLYIMLYTMNGFPSLYYKSEMGAKGKRTHTSDYLLREPFYKEEIQNSSPLLQAIQKLATIRKHDPCLKHGDYQEVLVEHQVIAYLRSYEGKKTLIIINSSNQAIEIASNKLQNQINEGNQELVWDALNQEELSIKKEIVIYPNWGRIIRL